MTRRFYLMSLLGMSGVAVGATKPRKFAFKIRTKDGKIVSNVAIEAHDLDAAKVKLFQRYPGSTVLRVDKK